MAMATNGMKRKVRKKIRLIEQAADLPETVEDNNADMVSILNMDLAYSKGFVPCH